MCDKVIIHYLNGQVITCGSQLELHMQMPNGIFLYDVRVWLKEWGYGKNDQWVDLLLSSGFNWSCCLCPIDLELTAHRNGFISSKYDIEQDEYDAFDTHFYEVPIRPRSFSAIKNWRGNHGKTSRP